MLLLLLALLAALLVGALLLAAVSRDGYGAVPFDPAHDTRGRGY